MAIFQADVCPIPISVSPTQADFLFAEMACPIRPEILSSLVVYSYSVLVNFIRVFHTALAYLDIERGIETHRQVTCVVF